jgi:hypothetical protein
MASVLLTPEMQRYADGATRVDVAAGTYRELVSELCRRFPGLPEELVRRQALAIDGMIVQEPLLETFRAESDLVFFARIAGG